MCYQPITITNTAKHLFPASRFKISVPCGVCFQCQRQKSLEYEMRAYYEFKDCLDKGGFVYTDCLTYADNFLPRLKTYISYIPDEYNYSCFSYVDFRLFMVRLRKHLERLGYVVKDNLRYFMASEYGTSEGCTHRPHYHIIFYCTIPGITNVELSSAVSDCWKYGRTDGFPFKSLSYISKHTYSGVVADGDILKTISYISKYVAKQSFYNKLVKDRYKKLMDYFGYEKFSSESKQLSKDIRKYSFQFHRQSSGFGLSALGSFRNSEDELFERGCFIYKSLKSTMLQVPIPSYFQRKLFYELNKSVDGSLHWTLSEKGIKFKQDRLTDVVKQYALKIESLHSNLEHEDKNMFTHLLDGRRYEEFAEYLLVYKGRLKSDQQILREKSGVFVVDDPYTFQSLTLQPFIDSVFYNYNTSKHKTYYKEGLVSLVDIEKTKYFPKYKHFPVTSPLTISSSIRHIHNIFPRFDITKHILHNVPFCFTNKSFLAYVVNENSDPRFRHFDELFKLMSVCLCKSGALQQKAYDTIQKLSSFYKNIYKK